MNILEERGTFWWANKPVGDEQPAVPAEATGVLRVLDKRAFFFCLDIGMSFLDSQVVHE